MSTPLRILVGDTSLTIDWEKLRKQKSALINVQATHTDQKAMGLLYGLVEFLDAFQDAAAGVLGERSVFGKKT